MTILSSKAYTVADPATNTNASFTVAPPAGMAMMIQLISAHYSNTDANVQACQIKLTPQGSPTIVLPSVKVTASEGCDIAAFEGATRNEDAVGDYQSAGVPLPPVVFDQAVTIAWYSAAPTFDWTLLSVHVAFFPLNEPQPPLIGRWGRGVGVRGHNTRARSS